MCFATGLVQWRFVIFIFQITFHQILATCFYFPDSILDVVFIVSSEPAECLSSKPRPTGIGAFSSSRADGTGGESSTAGRDARNVISTVFSSVSPPLF